MHHGSTDMINDMRTININLLYALDIMICITVSVNYDNLLDIILPQNAKFFKKWYIVTHKHDNETINIIKKYNFPNVEILFFDFYDGAIFNKGGGVRYAQSLVRDGETVLILDSDIFIPDGFLQYINMDLEIGTLYSLERYDYYTYNDFIEENSGKRYDSTFMGFFQLYKHQSHLLYNHSDSCRVCDANFADFFTNKKMLYGTIIKHLGRDNINHFGRTSRDDFLIN